MIYQKMQLNNDFIGFRYANILLMKAVSLLRTGIEADYGELKLTVADASGFKVVMIIQVIDNHCSECWDVSTAVITDIVDNKIYTGTYLGFE
jgi:hypothetical protein